MRSAFALRIISGIIIYNFGIAERLRTLRYPIFTGGVWNEPSQAHFVRQIPPFVAARHLPPERGKSFLSGGALFVLTDRCKKLPLSGELASSKAR